MKINTAKHNAKKLIKKYGHPIMLNVGCGTDYKKGWINIDNNSDNNIKRLDLNWDLRNQLPFDDESVDFIFNEHFFEHLDPEEAKSAMKNLMAKLKPGGIMRIAMPDLGWVVNNYLNINLKTDPLIKKYQMGYIKTKAEYINISFRWWGHKWLYDWEELTRRAEECGYQKIVRCRHSKSKNKELIGLETRDESLLIAEITK